jgi:hypothetical protein
MNFLKANTTMTRDLIPGTGQPGRSFPARLRADGSAGGNRFGDLQGRGRIARS